MITVLIAICGSALLLFLLFFVCLCILKQRKARRRAAVVARADVDENPVYGVYFDPNPRMEMVDRNVNYSSDYEAGTGTSRTTDNNPYYE